MARAARKLLIVESPGKVKTLKQILGPDWKIEASIGHVSELSYRGAKRLGFEFHGEKVLTWYEPRGERAEAVLKKLRAAAESCEMVFLATDPDREGEAIAWHLVEMLKLKRHCRVAYTQITDAAVKKAIANPLTLDTNLIASQRARQCLDKLVGFEVSPLLWSSTGGKSAGRVQSATLHLVCERERERLAFVPQGYWLLKATYREGFEATFERELAKDEPAENAARVFEEARAKEIEAIARANPHVVTEVEKKEESRNPPPPLITSTLQQVAGVRFRFSPKHTMKVAQELYEGVQGKGLITYMRTDAVALSPEFVHEARDWLQQNRSEVLPEKAPFYRAKKDAQGAHEAIRPTSAFATPEKVRGMLSPDQQKLYTLIWERAIASQCKPARLSRTKVVVKAASTSWIARGMTVLESGYLAFWKNLDRETELPTLAPAQTVALSELSLSQSATRPPPRYSEPALVQLMEKKGIGRPSTYASTVATLKDRDYAKLEEGAVAPTALGMATDEALTRALPALVDVAFTAKMESELDQIAEGQLSWEKYLISFSRDVLDPAVIQAKELLKGVARVAGEKGQGGRRAGAKTPPVVDAETLGRAIAKARRLGVEPKCPKGHGPLALKVSRKGTYYWKCAHSPCEEIAWYEQYSSQKCPRCTEPFQKIPSKKVSGGYFLKCARKEKHPEEVVLFKNKKTGLWMEPRPRFQSVSNAAPGKDPA